MIEFFVSCMKCMKYLESLGYSNGKNNLTMDNGPSISKNRFIISFILKTIENNLKRGIDYVIYLLS